MSAMRFTYLLTLAILCTATVFSAAHHFRPYIISGWPIMIGDEDQSGIPDDIRLSKTPDSIAKRFHPGWNAFQNQLRNQ